MDGQRLSQSAFGLDGTTRPGAMGNEVDLLAIAGTLWRGKLVILAISLICAALAYTFLSKQIPLYRAEAKVIFVPQKANVDAAGEAVIRTLRTNSSMQNQIEILRSVALIQGVIDDLGLQDHPQFAGPTTQRRPLTDLLPERLRERLGLQSNTAPMPIGIGDRRQNALIGAVLHGQTLWKVPNSDVIAIRFTSPDAQLAADIVNAMAARYIGNELEGKLETFRSATQWLSAQVAETQIRLETAESAVLAAQARIATEAGASLSATLNQRDSIAEDLIHARRDVAERRSRFEQVRSALEADLDLGGLPEFQNSRMVTRLRTRAAELLAKDAALAETFRPTHPKRTAITAEHGTILKDLHREAERILEAIRRDLVAAEDRVAQLDTDLRDAEDRTLRMSSQSVEIRNLEREAQASRQLYEDLLARHKETTAQEELQTADARILTAARAPLRPLSTARTRVLTGAAILGALLGGALVLLKDFLTTTLRTPAEAEDLLHVPVIGTLSTLGHRKRRATVVRRLLDKPNSAFAEGVRNLRTSILAAGELEPPKVVVFTSAVPGEGKTTTAMLTAMASQLMGKATILVDCDLRRPALTRILRTDPKAPDLVTVLNHEAPLEAAIHREEGTGLHVLLAQSKDKAPPVAPTDVLASEGFQALITTLAQRYDLVVIDTPPTLAVPDARIVAPLADAVVFVLRWNNTDRGAAEDGLRELTSVDAPVVGLAMTRVDERRARRHSYDGRGYYRGQYRGYYST